MTLASWLGIAGFVLSVFNCVVGLMLAWLKWPRIDVEVQPIQIIDVNPGGPPPPKPRHDTFQVRVINRGSDAVGIKNIGLCDAARRHVVRSDWTNTAPAESTGRDSAELIRIEGQGHQVWNFVDDESLREFPHWTEVFGFVDRYKSFRWWSWWPRRNPLPVRRVMSKSSVVRTGGADQPE